MRISLLFVGTLLLLLCSACKTATPPSQTNLPVAQTFTTATSPTIATAAAIPAHPPETPTPHVGERIHHPALDAANIPNQRPFLTLRQAQGAPIMSQQEAMQLLHDLGYPYALGGAYEGREVTITALYGVFTAGYIADTPQQHVGNGLEHPSGGCAGWIGHCNVPVQICHDGNCVPTGNIIPRIQNRPYWILDYKNIIVERKGCPDCSTARTNHTVIALDALDKFVLTGWGYNAP